MVYTKYLKTEFIEDLSKEKVSMKEFKESLDRVCIEEDIFDVGDTVEDKDSIEYALELADDRYGTKNLGEVFFEMENTIISDGAPLNGFFEINGFPFLGFLVSGDWEDPILAIIFTKKSTPNKFYLYTPLRGNVFSPELVKALQDVEAFEENSEPEFDKILLIQDLKDAFNL